MTGGMNQELWLSHTDEVRPQIELQQRIWDELHRHSEIDTDAVSVWVEDFVATLNGSVVSSPARVAVEQVVVRVRGVRSIVNQLQIVSASADI